MLMLTLAIIAAPFVLLGLALLVLAAGEAGEDAYDDTEDRAARDREWDALFDRHMRSVLDKSLPQLRPRARSDNR